VNGPLQLSIIVLLLVDCWLLVVWGEYINQQVISKEEKLDIGDDSGVFRDATEDYEKARGIVKVLSHTPVFFLVLLYFRAVLLYFQGIQVYQTTKHGRSEKYEYSCSKRNAHGRNMILK
jgi:hypothetical protein